MPQNLFSFLLVVVGAGQVYFLWLTRTDIQKTAQATETNATAAKDGLEIAKRNAEDTRQSIAIAKDTAEAAKRSAEVSELAIYANRPLLVVTKFDLSGFKRSPLSLPPEKQSDPAVWGDWVLAHFTIRNAGVSPAIIESAVTALSIWPKEELPPIGDYGECKALFIPDTVLKHDETQAQLMPFKEAYLADFEFDALASLKSRLVVYGLIRYRGLVGKQHETPFLWIWQLAGCRLKTEGTETKPGFFYRGPDDRNRNT